MKGLQSEGESFLAVFFCEGLGGYLDCCLIGLAMLFNHPQENQLVTELTE